jgi:hypothetical protein
MIPMEEFRSEPEGVSAAEVPAPAAGRPKVVSVTDYCATISTMLPVSAAPWLGLSVVLHSQLEIHSAQRALTRHSFRPARAVDPVEATAPKPSRSRPLDS